MTFSADLTSSKAPGKPLHQELGGVTLPLLAVFGPGVDTPLQTNAYTDESVITMIGQARGSENDVAVAP